MRFFISALAWLMVVWLGLTCLGMVGLLVLVIVRATEGRYSLVVALLVGGLTVLMGWLFGALLAQTIRHIRRPDQGTAKDVVAVACFVLGSALLRGLSKGILPVLNENGISLNWQLAGVLLYCVLWLLAFRYVPRSLSARAYAPQVAEGGPH